jgi:CubicO group peptidase (beta-lactamase class C family)
LPAWCHDRLVVAADLLGRVDAFIDAGDVPGAIVGVLRDGEMSLDVAGVRTVGTSSALTVDSPVRISSNTKPLVAALAMALLDDSVLTLGDPVERFVPELADRRVLRRIDGDPSDVVPAARSVTVEDLLTMRLGFGFVFESSCPAVAAADQAGLGMGPPDPSVPLTPDAWIARFAEFPLVEQPGTVWRYDFAFAVLGVLLARAARRPLDELMRERLLDPLGMHDTGFVAPPGRLPTCYAASESGLAVFDDAEDSRWTRRPAFPDARGGMVSTAADLLRFAAALLDEGAGVITPASVTAMTSDQLTAQQRQDPPASAFLNGAGWGYGVEVTAHDPAHSGGTARYGWGGGLGTLWYTWPERRCAAVLLTQVLPPSAPMFDAFIDGAEALLLSDKHPG